MDDERNETSNGVPVAPDLVGLWRRQEIVLADGTADRTTRVFWAQTHYLYVDIRIPSDRPSGGGRKSLMDYSLAELQKLAEQKGFAGHITLEGRLCRWIRYINYRPDNGRPDEGYLTLDGNRLYEEGGSDSVLGSAYREIYERDRRGDRRLVALRRIPLPGSHAAASPAGEGILIIVDDRFLYARSRPIELPSAESLTHLVIAAGDDPELVHAYLDCEISYGRIDKGAPWHVELSTLPFREGRRISSIATVRPCEEQDRVVFSGRDGSESWQIVESSLSRDDLVALLNR